MREISYNSWKLATPVAIILAFTGLVTGAVEFFVAAMIPYIMLMLSYLSRTPEAETIQLARKVSDKAPSPGQEVEVFLKVRNRGSKTVTDVRVIDSVPEELKVTEGSPRGSFAVSPGSVRQLSYRVMARRGSHVFEDVNVELRGGGQKAVVEKVPVKGDQQIECKTELSEIALRDKTEEQVGDIVTKKGGSGIEFHSLRDYKSSDPPSRVEWKHMAKTGELATKNFREESSGNIILVIDSRPVSNRKAEKGHPTGTDISAYAAKRVYKALLGSRHKPGIAILGVSNSDLDTATDSSMLPYVKPGRTRKKRRKVEQVLLEAQQADNRDESELKSELYKLLPPNSQVIFFSPLLDDEIISAIKILDRHGFPSTVVSPDVTYGHKEASKIAKIKRDLRLRKVRGVAPVIDWNIKRPISMQVSKALRRIYAREI